MNLISFEVGIKVGEALYWAS